MTPGYPQAWTYTKPSSHCCPLLTKEKSSPLTTGGEEKKRKKKAACPSIQNQGSLNPVYFPRYLPASATEKKDPAGEERELLP